MNTTIRTAQTLVMYNGFGSSTGETFPAGTTLEEITAKAQACHDRSVENSSDNLQRDVFRIANLVSKATGKELRKISIIQRNVSPRSNIYTLSPRQREVYALRHLSNEEISQRLGCSPASVEQYRIQGEQRSKATEIRR